MCIHNSTQLNSTLYENIIPQIALAIGVLTSNRRGVGYQLWRGSRWVPLLGAIAGAPLLGRHCWVLATWVPLLGAIAGCHAGVPLLGAISEVPLLGASYQLWRSSRWVHLSLH